jgi:hypothetical protein
VLSRVEGTVGAMGWSSAANPEATEALKLQVEKAGEDFLK